MLTMFFREALNITKIISQNIFDDVIMTSSVISLT